MKTLKLTTQEVIAIATAIRILNPADRVLPLSGVARSSLAIAFSKCDPIRLEAVRSRNALIREISGGGAIDPAKDPELYRQFSERYEEFLAQPIVLELDSITRSDFDQLVLPIPHLAALAVLL